MTGHRHSNTHCHGINPTIGLLQMADGRHEIRLFCQHHTDQHGHKSITTGLPQTNHPNWQQYPTLRTHPPTTYGPCCVKNCPNPATERHHWAPRKLWPTTADDWPTDMICRQHHTEWHTRTATNR